mmetsp:Transcript_66676/g.124526  ORF Transcript_66676/g.124526 Transcript_66676/m.124526 type:complete len:701 (+) Transcript_66676:85-2187(+)
MILYNNKDVAGVIFRRTGSVIFTAEVMVPAWLSTTMCAALLTFDQADEKFLISDSTARIYATIIGFVIVMRTSMAFGRFFSGIEYSALLFSKWRDAYVTLAAMIAASSEHWQKEGNPAAVRHLEISKARLLHWFTLLSAVAVARLQNCEEDDAVTEGGHSMPSLSFFDEPNVALLTPGSRRQQPSIGPDAFARPSAWVPGQGQPPDGARTTTVSRNTALSRRGRRATQGPDGARCVVRPSWASLGRSTGLDAARTNSADIARERSKRNTSEFGRMLRADDMRCRVVGKLTSREEEILYATSDEVGTVLKWILYEISDLSASKMMVVAPAIVARIYQELSNGMLGFFQAKTISDVPFPFPFAQFLQYALMAFYLFVPFVTLDSVSPNYSKWLSLPMNFFACAGFTALNEIAIEIEDPFGEDPNDYPFHVNQWTFVSALEDAYLAEAPHDFEAADLDGGIGNFKAKAQEKVATATKTKMSEERTGKAAGKKAANAPDPTASLKSSMKELQGTLKAAHRWLQVVKHQQQRVAGGLRLAEWQSRLQVMLQSLLQTKWEQPALKEGAVLNGESKPMAKLAQNGEGSADESSDAELRNLSNSKSDVGARRSNGRGQNGHVVPLKAMSPTQDASHGPACTSCHQALQYLREHEVAACLLRALDEARAAAPADDATLQEQKSNLRPNGPADQPKAPVDESAFYWEVAL